MWLLALGLCGCSLQDFGYMQRHTHEGESGSDGEGGRNGGASGHAGGRPSTEGGSAGDHGSGARGGDNGSGGTSQGGEADPGGSHTGAAGRGGEGTDTGGSANGGDDSGGKGTGGDGNGGDGNGGTGGVGTGGTGQGGNAGSEELPNTSTPPGPWRFDTASDVEDWLEKSDSIVATWVEDGQAEPLGAMRVDVTAQTEIELSTDGLVDLRDRVMWMRVRALAEPPVGVGGAGGAGGAGEAPAPVTTVHKVKVYGMSDGFAWADGGEVVVGETWTLASFNLNVPSYEAVDFDPSRVMLFGLAVITVSAIVVDEVWIESINGS